MENAALTTALVGIIIALVKLVEYLIKKYQVKSEVKQLSESKTSPALHPEQGRQLRELHE